LTLFALGGATWRITPAAREVIILENRLPLGLPENRKAQIVVLSPQMGNIDDRTMPPFGYKTHRSMHR